MHVSGAVAAVRDRRGRGSGFSRESRLIRKLKPLLQMVPVGWESSAPIGAEVSGPEIPSAPSIYP